MLRRFLNRLKFELERFVVRSPLHRLVFIALLIAIVSVGGGLLARSAGGNFKSDGDAIWWAFLRLTDPGYLGDDQGAALRVVSTIVTVLGYVIFLGALVAIMTQWLDSTMAKLESGLTPIAANDHIVILGYSSRTAAIVRELLVSEGRVSRFLDARGAARLRIVILAEKVNVEVVQELKDRLGPLWNPRQVTLRSGTPLRIDHLHRVDFLHAAAILLPAVDLAGDGSATPDARTIKALLAIASSSRTLETKRLPLVVAEVVDSRRVAMAERAYPGPIEVLAADGFVGRLLVQAVRHPGISAVYEELLAPAGDNDIYVRRLPELDGQRIDAITGVFAEAIVLGVVRAGGPRAESILAPPGDFVLAATDHLVFVATSFEACTPTPTPTPTPAPAPKPERRPSGLSPAEAAPRERAVPGARRVLVLGWNQKVPALLREVALAHDTDDVHEVDVFSVRAKDEREAVLAGELDATRIRVRHLEGDYTAGGALRRLDPASYDNVVLVASDWVDSEDESDARTILGHLLLEEALAGKKRKPAIVAELMDAENVELLTDHQSEILVSATLLSHILTQVALRPDLHAVYSDLFGADGGEFAFRRASGYGLTGAPATFAEALAAAAEHGEIALGFRHAGALALNPPRQKQFSLGEGDDVIVVTSFEDVRRSRASVTPSLPSPDTGTP
jgi:ion channel POLLUX/CASTOR